MTTPWPEPTGVPERMRAVVFERFGPPEVLQQTRLDTPRPGRGEVLIQVGAVSVGRLLDIAARAGRHPYASFRFPHVLGAEHAGTVAALGEDVDGLRIGDRVAVFPAVSCGACTYCRDAKQEVCPQLSLIGTHRPGAYAEYCAVPARNVHPVPDGLTPAEVAALAMAGPVAANQLAQAGLRRGDWVLVQGAASALGSTTAALARHLGAQVIATSRSADKRAALAASGIDVVLDATAGDFADQVRAVTGGRGVDIAIDNLGDPLVWEATMDSLARGGAVVCSGAFLGGKVQLDLLRLYSCSYRLIGVRTGNPASIEALWTQVEQGFRAVLDRTFPIARAADAHRYLEDDTNTGRVALTFSREDWTPGE